MISRAISRYIRISPRKFRQIVPLIKGKNPEEAIAFLSSVKKKASVYAIELLKSAVANAKRVQGIDLSGLYISNITADCGPMLKRYRAGSMGRASMIKKRTSHLTVELDERKAPKQEEKAHAAKAIKSPAEDKKTKKNAVRPKTKEKHGA